MNVDVIESLVVASHRLTQLAAQATGDRTPAAVWRTLSVLQHEGPLRVGTLAALSRVTQPGITRLVGTMHDDGYVERISDATDSRASVISVTRVGVAALEEWRHTIARTMEPAFGSLDEQDWAALSRAAEILATRTASATAVAS
ncbi:MAG: MarR family transcriptional regulator [Pseudolysinimonas sp.]|uniref:MarR family winged helix-turn-helix transcriptional regulator n=1 Tax=Pseudolysinimonas sp. TaxID=2680009 RepID=UPI003266AE62